MAAMPVQVNPPPLNIEHLQAMQQQVQQQPMAAPAVMSQFAPEHMQSNGGDQKAKRKRKKEPEMVPVTVPGHGVIMVPASPPPVASLADDGKKQRKPKKDKNAPKKPPSAYLVFLGRHREEIKRTNPTMTISQVTTEMAKMWQSVSPEEKAICMAKAEEEKGRYYKAMSEYVPQPPTVPPAAPPPKDGKGGKKRKKDKNAPKKARSAYIFFSQDYRAKNKQTLESATFELASKAIGDAWAKLGEADRAVYVQMANAEAEKYASDMNAFKQVKAAEEEKLRDEARMAYAQQQVKLMAEEKKMQRRKNKAEREAKKADMIQHGVGVHGGALPPQLQHQQQGSVPGNVAFGNVGMPANPAAAGFAAAGQVSLWGLDMSAVKAGVDSVTNNSEAYFLLVDAMYGQGRERVEAAVPLAVMGDWKAFVIGALGLKAVKKYLKG